MRLIDKDTIYRQGAVEALKNAEPLVRDFGYYKVIETIRLLPSAQSERPFEIQDILNYLDTVLYPIISPEHWNVYSELHDMISALPSATQQKPLKSSGNGTWVYIVTNDGGSSSIPQDTSIFLPSAWKTLLSAMSLTP